MPWLSVCFCLATLMIGDGPRANLDPATAEGLAAINQQLDAGIERITSKIKQDDKNLDLYSERGDLRLFRGDFAGAVQDYERMIVLQPSLEAGHWRRGIACFYAGKYDDAAHQFEIYHTADDVDRENGIWRFLSQAKSAGVKKARAGLLKYQKDDREPFPDVYKMFAGELTGEQVLARIAAAKLGKAELEKRLFYAELYIGLNEFVEGRVGPAEEHLQKAVANKWAPEAGFGPAYMWQVGRVHYWQLVAKRADTKKTK